MSYLHEFITLALIGVLGAVSPGPDFIVVARASLCQGKLAGIYTAVGVALGCLVHITYCIIGIGVIVSQSILAFNLIKYLGAAYLIYIGIKSLKAKSAINFDQQQPALTQQVKAFANIKTGFLVNALNPKATLFFLSVFTQVIDPHTPKIIQALFGAEFSIIGFAWFASLSLILSSNSLKAKLKAAQKFIDKILGGALILLGIKIATIQQ